MKPALRLVQSDIEAEIERLVPGIERGMPMTEAMILILNELKRLQPNVKPATTFTRFRPNE